MLTVRHLCCSLLCIPVARMSSSQAQVIYKAAIAAVSPPTLVARALNFAPHSKILKIGDHSYALNKSVSISQLNQKLIHARLF